MSGAAATPGLEQLMPRRRLRLAALSRQSSGEIFTCGRVLGLLLRSRHAADSTTLYLQEAFCLEDDHNVPGTELLNKGRLSMSGPICGCWRWCWNFLVGPNVFEHPQKFALCPQVSPASSCHRIYDENPMHKSQSTPVLIHHHHYCRCCKSDEGLPTSKCYGSRIH